MIHFLKNYHPTPPSRALSAELYMGFLGNIFNDVVDIVSAPIKIVTKVVDKTIGEPLDSDLTGFVDDIKDTIKTEED